MRAFKIREKDKNLSNESKNSKQSKLTLEIAEALIEVKQIQEGKIKALSLKDI